MRLHIRLYSSFLPNETYLNEKSGLIDMSPVDERDITTVGIPKTLRERYLKLKHFKDYHSFAEFCRTAVLEKIKEEEKENRS